MSTYRIETVKIGDVELSFKVRKLTFTEGYTFRKKSEGGKMDDIDLFFYLIDMGVYKDMDDTPLFEQTDKDTIKNSEINDSITQLFLSFAKTDEDSEDIEKN